MWILSPIGFFSVVRKPNDVQRGSLTVRVRVRTTLLPLKRESRR